MKEWAVLRNPGLWTEAVVDEVETYEQAEACMLKEMQCCDNQFDIVKINEDGTHTTEF